MILLDEIDKADPDLPNDLLEPLDKKRFNVPQGPEVKTRRGQNILIIITRPENMKYFEKIVQVLDVETSPDVEVRVIRLEFADAKEIAKSLGIHRIELDVMGFNKGARHFYSDQGFSERGYRMYSDEPIA